MPLAALAIVVVPRGTVLGLVVLLRVVAGAVIFAPLTLPRRRRRRVAARFILVSRGRGGSMLRGAPAFVAALVLVGRRPPVGVLSLLISSRHVLSLFWVCPLRDRPARPSPNEHWYRSTRPAPLRVFCLRPDLYRNGIRGTKTAVVGMENT